MDIRRPLGHTRTPSIEAVSEVASFYARRDFTVASRSTIAGMRLQASDGLFATDTGPLVSGTMLALTMAMAGRRAYCDDLTGPGVPTVRARCGPSKSKIGGLWFVTSARRGRHLPTYRAVGAPSR